MSLCSKTTCRSDFYVLAWRYGHDGVLLLWDWTFLQFLRRWHLLVREPRLEHQPVCDADHGEPLLSASEQPHLQAPLNRSHFQLSVLHVHSRLDSSPGLPHTFRCFCRQRQRGGTLGLSCPACCTPIHMHVFLYISLAWARMPRTVRYHWPFASDIPLDDYSYGPRSASCWVQWLCFPATGTVALPAAGFLVNIWWVPDCPPVRTLLYLSIERPHGENKMLIIPLWTCEPEAKHFRAK